MCNITSVSTGTVSHIVVDVLFLCSPVPADTQEVESVDAPEVQPFSLEEVEMELHDAPPSCTPPIDQSERTDPVAPSQDRPEPSRNLIEMESIEESNSKTQEVRGHTHEHTYSTFCRGICSSILEVSLLTVYNIKM